MLPQQQAAIKRRILHHQLGMQVAARLAETVALAAVVEHQLALLKARQQFEQQLLGPLVDERGREG